MIRQILYGLVACLSLSRIAAADCSTLKIDDFAQYSNSVNSLGGYTDDDGSMASISVSGTSLILTPVPPADGRLSPSYYYENLPCVQSVTEAYKAIKFTMKAPAPGSNFTLEIQTRASCSATAFQSDWQVVRDLTGQAQTVIVPLGGWLGANTNLNAITGFNWATWTSPTQSNGEEDWQLGGIDDYCLVDYLFACYHHGLYHKIYQPFNFHFDANNKHSKVNHHH
ncbi:uncharacterized protein BCR38DRAFT_491063 [Pseudomassariella vexata]|uniref:Uncharacterized protein n=1 Tax=Pseudomassariella vexata TaxID=1141098 RepID=A0A1Y2D934_9PEZI|nr:uncharacterized protein BCR38DRAFT_491063 [Pseudomassariella vexata]ORY55717.1 hypothetical protein BCR38DRAFT_491063 [Pseudomassariella vexata]